MVIIQIYNNLFSCCVFPNSFHLFQSFPDQKKTKEISILTIYKLRTSTVCLTTTLYKVLIVFKFVIIPDTIIMLRNMPKNWMSFEQVIVFSNFICNKLFFYQFFYQFFSSFFVIFFFCTKWYFDSNSLLFSEWPRTHFPKEQIHTILIHITFVSHIVLHFIHKCDFIAEIHFQFAVYSHKIFFAIILSWYFFYQQLNYRTLNCQTHLILPNTQYVYK